MANTTQAYKVEKLYFSDFETLENKLNELADNNYKFVDWLVRPKRLGNNMTMMCVILSEYSPDEPDEPVEEGTETQTE